MARKITDEDLANRGVMGLPDVPGLTAIEMQKKLEEIPREVIIPRYNELVDSVADICDEFSKLNSYAVGDYCIYQNKLYKCNTETNGDWDASKWTETSVGDELKSVNSNLKWKLIGSIVGTGTSINLPTDTYDEFLLIMGTPIYKWSVHITKNELNTLNAFANSSVAPETNTVAQSVSMTISNDNRASLAQAWQNGSDNSSQGLLIVYAK